MEKSLKEKVSNEVFHVGNIIGISTIVIAALYPFHKQILPHKIINRGL